MRWIRAALALSVSLIALGCAPEPPSAVSIAGAALRVGEERELAPLHGTDVAGMTGYPQPSMFCDQRDACVVIGFEDVYPVLEILAFPLRHDGTPTGTPRVVAASTELGLERRVLAAAGTAGFAVSYYETVSRDGPWRWRRWLQLLGPDGGPSRERIALAEHAEHADSYAELWFDGRAYVATTRDASGAITMTRVDPATGGVLDRAPLPDAPYRVTCGPVECIAAIGGRTVLFRRDESPARARTSAVAPGAFAASRYGYAVWRWDDSEIEWLALDGTPTARTSTTRHMLVASGGDTILVYGATEAGLVLAEIDPRLPPPTLALRAFAGWWHAPFPVWSGTGWLVGHLRGRVLGSWEWQEPDWMRVAPGSLDVEERFEGDEDLRASTHDDLVLASDEGAHFAAWRETEDHFTEERVRLVRLASDGAVTASTSVEHAYRARLAIGGDVVALVASRDAMDTLYRFDRSLRPVGDGVPVPFGSSIAWDGERFVVGTSDSLMRHAPQPDLPPVAIPVPSAEWSDRELLLVTVPSGALAAIRSWRGSWVLARWDRELGWRDGAGVTVSGNVEALAARGATVALWTEESHDGGAWSARLSTVDTAAAVLSV
ncbi:hypothetical protein [Sandaracinus amylolyticus]|uniref:Lipoprotein n=1 Tax=Sandaracinus amylolyticus TaxID=927083 RepID=A0A0F6W8D7_9BACT|nr:hypothetical protein [Sandaracinus amylolyticus]AKF10106.1 hypothetical protein DB32_007255 [Sandaracinus amylolyticus]